MLPNFLIIGGARCATGWTSQCLREHPDIFMAQDETHFFDRHYHKGLNWWAQTYFSTSAYRDEKMVGEKTAGYLYDPKDVPQRIIASLSPIKLICNLRDPVERMHSVYQRGVLKGTQKLSLVQVATPDSKLVQHGLYFQHIKRFLEVFPQENILIKIYEDKFVDPVSFIQDIYRFLDVDNTFVPPSIDVQTKSGLLESKNKLLKTLSRVLLHPRGPFFFKSLYSKIRPKHNDDLVKINGQALAELAPLFRNDIIKLEKFLGRDLRCWQSRL